MATVINIITRYNFRVKYLLFIYFESLPLKEYNVETRYACAITSNIIKNNITSLLNNLYRSLSNLIPKKIECIVKATADAIPKYTTLLKNYQ